MRRKNNNFLITLFKVFLLLFTLLVVQPSILAAETIDKKVEEAVLAEDWGKVAKLLDSVNPETPSPVLRMIKGHADLALNKNNESLSLFVVISFEDLKKWKEWGETFVSKYETKSIAHYFLGDIYSREGDLAQAHKHFSKAIEINKDNYLAWNARGVISTLRKEYRNSMEDFSKVLKIKPDFMDVNNNIAMMRINQGQGRKGAIKRFRSVIDSDPNFALPYHGLGCLELLKAQKLATEENKNIQKALELVPDAQELLIINEARFADAFLDKQAESLFADAGQQGTSLKRDYKLRELIDKADKISNIRTQLPSSASDFTKKMVQKREHKAQFEVANQLNKMSPLQRREFAQNNPKSFPKGINAVSLIEQRYKSGLDQTTIAVNDIRKIVTVANVFSKGSLSPVQKFTDLVSNAGLKNVRRAHSEMETLKSSLVNDMDYVIRNKISVGTYNPVQIQTPSKNLSRGIPGKRETFNPSKGALVHSSSVPLKYSGATTDKASVTWDDNKWPFMPIFGLLYFAPQTNSETNGG